MAQAASRATLKTTLRIGNVEVAVGLFSTVAKPKPWGEFVTAGPNGGVLKARPVARAMPVAETETIIGFPGGTSDPLAEMGPGPGRERDEFDREQTFAGLPVVADERMPEGRAAVISDIDIAGVTFDASSVDGEYGSELYEEGTGVVVAPKDVRRGVRLEDGRFIDCTDQVAEITERTMLERMDVLAFVDVTQIPRSRVKGAQWIGADDERAPHALRVLYEGLHNTRRAAVVKLTKRSRQTLGVIACHFRCLILFELVWAEDFRDPPPRAVRIQREQVSEVELNAMVALIDATSASISALNELRDDALELREELLAKAWAGEVPHVLDPRPAPVDATPDLVAELEASLAAVGA